MAKDIWLVSACLLGEPCRYDGGTKSRDNVIEFLKDKEFYPICPECLGGLLIPRPPAEIQGGNGMDVLKGQAEVIRQDGEKVTAAFLKGAYNVLALAQKVKANKAILKANSPSCSNAYIYDGSFSQQLIPGEGVTAALLRQNNIKVFSEKDL